jgi:hypothetical protein
MKDERMRIYELPYTPPEEYDFELEFTRQGGSIMHILAAKGHTFLHELRPEDNGPSPTRSGFAGLDGVAVDRTTGAYALLAAPSPDDTRHVVTVQVRRDEVRSFLDGKEIVRWKGDLSRLALPDHMRLGGTATHLGIASRGGDVTFHRATVREISGPGSYSAPVRNVATKKAMKPQRDAVTAR